MASYNWHLNFFKLFILFKTFTHSFSFSECLLFYLEKIGKFDVDHKIKNEVQKILFPEEAIEEIKSETIDKFGASDIFDLN